MKERHRHLTKKESDYATALSERGPTHPILFRTTGTGEIDESGYYAVDKDGNVWAKGPVGIYDVDDDPREWYLAAFNRSMP